MAVESWSDVKQTTISKCFRHCGFYKSKCLVEVVDDSYNEFNQIKITYNSIVPKEEAFDLEVLVGIDNHLSVSEPLNENPIGDNIVVDFDKVEEDIDESTDELVDVVDIKTVNTSITDWKLYTLQRKNKEYALKLLKLVNEMEKLLFDEPKSYQQTLLNFYH
jgi:hypothetical protein